MTNDRSVSFGGDAVGNVVITGDRNKVKAQIEAKTKTVTLPAAASVDLPKELAAIRIILEGVGGEHASKVSHALDDASEEAAKPQPNRDEIGTALNRALDYAKRGTNFAEEVGKLVPHLVNAAAWLGSNWHHLLGVVGLAV